MRLYTRYFSIQMKSLMQYKLSFFLTMLGQLLTSFSALLGVWFLMARFHAVKGFALSEVLLCFGVLNMSFSAAEGFARGFDRFQVMIANGEFDRILVRPRNEIFQILASKIEFSRMGRFIQALLVFSYAIPTSGIDWTWDKILTLTLMLLSGTAVFCGLFVVHASICFFTTEGLEVMNIFTDGSKEFGRYPFSVYGDKILKLFTYVVPIALFQYYPLLYLTGRTAARTYMFLPLAALLFLIPCYVFWRIGLRHYRSTGS